MTRQVHALLIAGDDPDQDGSPTANAEPALDNIEADLNTRFRLPNIKRLVNAPTVQTVNAAFAQIGQQIRTTELLVVMFAGHGSEPTRAILSQSWYLTTGEHYTDSELADRLLELTDRVDVVVISDCCYGQGFFKVGPLRFPGRLQERFERLMLRRQSRELVGALGRRWDGARRNSPMVCISAASKDDLVFQANLPELTKKVAEAAKQGESYSQLKATFASFTPAGGTYHVDARPSARMTDVVLHT